MRRDTTHFGLEGPILRRRREGLIDGLKLAMEGEEILLALDERIHEYRVEIGRLRETAGKDQVDSPEVLFTQYRMRTLSMIRDHIWEGHTYLLGKEDLEFAELLPEPPVSPLAPDSTGHKNAHLRSVN